MSLPWLYPTMGPISARIIMEAELYRRSIKPRSELLDFLNSAVGIWLLTTLSVSVLTPTFAFAYKTYEAHLARIQHVEKLKIELGGRISQFTEILLSLGTGEGDSFQLRPGITREGVRKIAYAQRGIPKEAGNVKDGIPILAIYPEFEARAFLSLYVELLHHLNNEQKDELERAVRFLWDDDLILDTSTFNLKLYAEKISYGLGAGVFNANL